MSITNYGELKAAIATRSRRSDLTSLLPDFVRSAHDVIVNRLAVFTTISADAATETLPTDFREMVVAVGEAYPAIMLAPVHPDQVSGSGTGAPQYYSASGGTLTLYPTPDDTYSVRILYKLARAQFDADADANTAMTRYPLLYLYGAMAEVFAHVRDLEQETKYRQLFAAGIDAASASEQDDLYTGLVLQPRMQGVV